MNSSRHSTKSRCPRCQTLTLESLPRSGFTDQLMKWFKRRPMRCHTCAKRCYIRKKGESRARSAQVADQLGPRHTAEP